MTANPLKLNFSAGVDEAGDAIRFTVTNDGSGPAGGANSHLVIALDVPVSALDDRLVESRTNAESSPHRRASLQSLVTLSGDVSGTWSAWVAATTGTATLRLAVFNDLDSSGEDAPPNEQGAIATGNSLHIAVPVKAIDEFGSTDVTSSYGTRHDRRGTRPDAATQQPVSLLRPSQPRPEPSTQVAFWVGDRRYVVQPGEKVSLHWKLPDGVKGTLHGLLSARDDEMTVEGKGKLEVRVLGPQPYLLQARIDDVNVVRTLVLDAQTEDRFGYLRVWPTYALPYGLVTAQWAAWGVSEAKLHVGKEGGIVHLLGSSHNMQDDKDGQDLQGKHIQMEESDTEIKLWLRVEALQNPPKMPAETVEINPWNRWVDDLPAQTEPLSLVYAASESQGVLALGAADGLWLADVGVQDPAQVHVPQPHFRPVPASEDHISWLDVTAYQEGFAAIRQLAAGAFELAFFDLDGELVGVSDVGGGLAGASTEGLAFAGYAVTGGSGGQVELLGLDPFRVARTLGSHTDRVSAVAVTRDGMQAISASYDKTLKLWDLKTGQCLHSFTGHIGEIWDVAVTPDGGRCVSASPDGPDGEVRIWNLTTRRCMQTLTAGKDFRPVAVAVSPDGAYVAASSVRDGSVKVWDLATYDLRHSFDFGPGPSNIPRSLMWYYGDELTLVGGTIGGGIVTWFEGDRHGFDEPEYLIGRGFLPILDIAVSPDLTLVGYCYITGGSRGGVVIDHYQGDRDPQRFNLEMDNDVSAVSVAPDSKRFLAIGREFLIWDKESRRDTRHQRGGTAVAASMGRQWGRLATLKDRIYVTLGNVIDPKPWHTLVYDPIEDSWCNEPALKASGNSRLFALDGSLFALDQDTGTLQRFDPDPAAETGTLSGPHPVAPAVDEKGRDVPTQGVPVVIDNLLVFLGGFGGIPAPWDEEQWIPQDGVYDAVNDRWHLCGHGLDLGSSGVAAFRGGEGLRVWAIGGRPVPEGDDGDAAGHTLGLDDLRVFTPRDPEPEA